MGRVKRAKKATQSKFRYVMLFNEVNHCFRSYPIQKSGLDDTYFWLCCSVDKHKQTFLKLHNCVMEKELVLDELPSDVLVLIFSNLSLDEIFTCAFVNQVFRRNAKFQSLRLRDGIFDLGLKELDRQDYKSAVVNFGKLLALFPNDYETRLEYAVCRREAYSAVQGLLDLRLADKYAELAKDDAFRKFIHAECFWMRETNARAKEEITKAIEQNPNKARFYHFRGFIEKDYDSEMKDYEQILKHHPTYRRMSTIYNNMGFAKSKIQLYEEGMELYLKAIEICPHHVRPYYNLAVIHAERRNHDEAVAVVNKILTINPNLTEVAALRGWVYHNNAQLKEALEDYITSLQKDQKDVETILNLHSITIFTGKLDDMIEVNRKFLDKLLGDLKSVDRKRENIKKALETTFKTLNEGLVVEDWNYIDPFIDVNKKELELKRALRKIYRNLAECHMQYGIPEVSRDEFREMLKYPTTDEKSTEKDQDSKFLSLLYNTSGIKIEDISEEAREFTKMLIGTISTPVLVARRRQIAEGRLRTLADVQFLFVNYCFKKMNLYFPGENHETRLTTLGKLLAEITNYFMNEHLSIKHKAMALFCTAPHFLFHLIEVSWRAQGPNEVPNTLEMQVTACYQQNEDQDEFLEKMGSMLNFHKSS